MDTIEFPYRSPSHRPLLKTIDESGAWEAHDVDVNWDYYIGMDESHEQLAAGEVDFVGGTHLSPYAERTRGDDWIYVGQAIDGVEFHLATLPDSDVSSVADLEGRVVTTRSTHPRLNKRLFLYQHGLDQEEGDVEMYDATDEDNEYDPVLRGDADASLLSPSTDLRAERDGLEVTPAGRLPMVKGTTLSTTRSYVEANEELLNRFVKGTMEGIAYFLNNPEETTQIIQDLGEYDDEMAEHVYDGFVDTLCPKLYPSPQAVANVYQEALWWDSAAAEVDAFELWDFQYLHEVVDSGFVDSLY